MKHDFYFDPKNVKRAYNDMCRLDREYDLRKKLIRAAARKGLNNAEAVEAADGILEGIAYYSAGQEIVVEDTERVLKDILYYMDQRYMSEKDMDLMYLGVILMNEPEARGKLNWGSTDELLKTYRDRIPEDYEQKRQAVASVFRTFSLTQSQLRDEAFNIRHYNDKAYQMAKVSKENLTATGMLAMYLYLDNRGAMTPRQAALITCTEKDFKTIGDAIRDIRKGQADTSEDIAVGSALSIFCGIGVMYHANKMRNLAVTAGEFAGADMYLLLGGLIVAVFLLLWIFRHEIAGWLEGHFLGVDDETLSHFQAPPKREREYEHEEITLFGSDLSDEEWDRLTDALVY